MGEIDSVSRGVSSGASRNGHAHTPLELLRGLTGKDGPGTCVPMQPCAAISATNFKRLGLSMIDVIGYKYQGGTISLSEG